MSMNRIFVLLIIGVLALSACGPSASDIQKAIEQTQAAQPTSTPIPTATAIPPTPTPTPIPLSGIDLASLLIQPGDLPGGVSGAQIREPVGDDDFPTPANQVFQQFEKNNKGMGGVSVWLFDDLADVETSYAIFEKSFKSSKSGQEVPEVGEKAWAIPPALTAALLLEASGLGEYTDSLVGELLFVRCHALVHIVLPYETDEIITLVGYGKRLDERLSGAVCP